MGAALKIHYDDVAEPKDGDGGGRPPPGSTSQKLLYSANDSRPLEDEMFTAAQWAIDMAAEQLQKSIDNPHALYALDVTLQFTDWSEGYKTIKGIKSTHHAGHIVNVLKSMEPTLEILNPPITTLGLR
jgi:hypothetical protein